MVKPKLRVAWFSAGVSSFIATYLTPNIDRIIYIDIDDQHSDSMRFVKDCEKVLCRQIEIIKSPLCSVENAIRQAGYITLRNGAAACTNLLKKRPRQTWEVESGIVKCSQWSYTEPPQELVYVWGLDCVERDRMDGIINANPKANHIFPLIDKGLTKEDAHGLCERLGVKRPLMYELGYSNNNCIGCVKGGMGYWNKIRVDFPGAFDRMAKLERLIGHSCLKDENGALFLDELDPARGRMQDEIMTDCSIFCELALR